MTRTEVGSALVHEERLRGGQMWSRILRRGQTLRLTDLEGGACVAALFYNADDPLERYNMPDTLKAQHIARLTAGDVLFSDMGRILCSIVKDTCGWHDPLSGCANAALVAEKYGEARYQEHRNAYHRNAYDSFVIELAKYGLGPRDMAAPINFFSKVVVADSGAMTFVPGNSTAGTYVELRAEMDVLVILNTCQHPLDPSPHYEPRPIALTVFTAPPVADDDVCRVSRPENARGFMLTERYAL